MQSSNVLVSDDRYALLLGRRLTHHLDDRGFCDLDRSMGTGPSRDKWNSAAEDAEEGHVAFDERHVHETAFYESDELLVDAQPDIGRREHYCLRIFDLCLFDRDILVEGYTGIPP